MREAVEASKNGWPAPNPHVGCVIVRGEEMVGVGWHEYAGGPHAEVAALTDAGDRAAGATAYVTQEPCNHFGRTPPCSQALIRAGIRRVVIATMDPNPKAAGGAQTLQDAGIEVVAEVLEAEVESVNEMFLSAVRRRRPVVVLKAAMSLDGRIALPSGESKWITGPPARLAGHRLRAECGAVLVGRRTVELDDPLLTARFDGVVNQPVRIVLDPSNRLTGKEQVFGPEAETMHVTGTIDLPELLSTLFERRVIGVLVEGGATTHGHFLREQLADRLEIFVGPKVLGDGPSWASGLGISALSQAPEFRLQNTQVVGADVQLSYDKKIVKEL